VFQVSDFREQRGYGATIAERVWSAWWKGAGHPLADVERHMGEMAGQNPLPMAVVAHDAGGYLGSAFLIHSDLEARPQYSPWVAAVWVDADKRRRGVGRALVAEAVRNAARLGFAEVYLCCRPEMEGFYTAMGWTVFERAVGAERLSVLKRELESQDA
jgi:GNAT superfamily N-acetyltransferase